MTSHPQLIGKEFFIDESRYVITDERNIDGEVMVYAEPEDSRHGPGRAAFRYVDIEAKLAQ